MQSRKSISFFDKSSGCVMSCQCSVSSSSRLRATIVAEVVVNQDVTARHVGFRYAGLGLMDNRCQPRLTFVQCCFGKHTLGYFSAQIKMPPTCPSAVSQGRVSHFTHWLLPSASHEQIFVRTARSPRPDSDDALLSSVRGGLEQSS